MSDEALITSEAASLVSTPISWRTAPATAARTPRVAIVHDWLVTYAGAERVLEQIIACFPEADLFSLVDFLEDRTFLRGKRATTSFIQHLPFARTRYRAYLPLMPLAIEQLDVSGYDLVISSSHAVAKGVLTGPDQLHVSYVHSPIRYAWDLQHQYLEQSHLTRGLRSALARVVLHYIRNWDIRTVNSVDHFVANSEFIARRIKKVYQREARVVFPPVDVDAFSLGEHKEDFYLTASRLVPYKKVELIVEAFARMPEKKLVVIGDGPQMHAVRAKAAANVEVMGYQPFSVLHEYMRRAKAFVFAAEEDFGIAPVEAQACGTPVIAYGKGGALETVRGLSQSSPTGLFFEEQSAAAIVAAVGEFERGGQRFSARDCRANAERFSVARFHERFLAYLDEVRPGTSALRSNGRVETAPAVAPHVANRAVARVPAPIKVLAVDQSGVLGGAELSLLELGRHMSDSVEVVLFDDGPFRLALEQAGVGVDVLEAPRLRGITKGGGLPRIATLRGIGLLVRETARRARHFDVIYANTQRAMVVSALAGAIARRPVVWHLRDIVSAEHFGRLQRMAIKWCGKFGLDHVIANSAASAKAFIDLTGARKERVDVVFNGISETPFRRYDKVPRDVLRERLGLPLDAFIVGSFSRLAHWKGQHVLLEAALRDPDMHVALVGAPLFGEHDYEASLKAFAQTHGMASRVHFLGFREDIPACMRAVDIIAHTSIAPEPFGRVIVEGMLAKRPVVGMRAGGVTEIVEDGTNGLLCEPDDATALAEALARLRTDEGLRARLIENGYEAARRRFGDQAYADDVRRILGRTAAREKP
ncbi:glycosyltransferase involved in cell wall biosynthesis [Trinickia symbiotica]|uniref:Glycosyl transferase family 1 n=1 Tax=Trinickia symbiotica TaxID=863227 RepID=A0A2N7WZV2_9BURK|nr:glycosyltransferase family 4 protein [Trinickia symbiotica]PMS35023.1 glycosyl transferase family 1 [Trinickia symbiotica]PPK43519.1 glycosyltransferase involved in cell wall biosynthesis [Trinickia symbiotica]